MARLEPLELPLRGLATVGLGPGFARELTNYALRNDKLDVRPACRTAQASAVAGLPVMSWYDYSGGKWYGIRQSNGAIYDLAAGSTGASVGGATNTAIMSFKHSTIEILCGAQAPRSPSYPFTSHGYICSTITDETTIVAGCSYNGRPMFTNGSTIEYGDVGQLTGSALNGGELPVSDFLNGDTIYNMFEVTLNLGLDPQPALVIFGIFGRVLVYAGDFPDASNWRLIGAFTMPPPASRVSFVPIDGDLIVMTAEYPYYISHLFAGGSKAAYDNRISAAIDDLWGTLTWTSTGQAYAFHLKNLGDEHYDAIVFRAQDNSTAGFSQIADYENSSVHLVYFRNYGAWAIWLMTPFLRPIREISSVFYAVNTVGDIKMLTAGNMQDQHNVSVAGALATYDIEANWKTPFIGPYRGQSQRPLAVRPYFRNSSSGYLHRVRAVYDFSDENAPWGFTPQSTVTDIPPGKYSDAQVDKPAQTWPLYSDKVDLSGVGGGVSFAFTQKMKSGSSATQVQRMSAAVALIEDGGVII